MTTTNMNHQGFSGNEKNSSRVLAPPGGRDNVSGLFGGSGDDKGAPRKQMSAGARRNYDSNVMATEDQENQMKPTETYQEQVQNTDSGPAKPIRPSEDSFGNLGFGGMPVYAPAQNRKKAVPEAYNIISGRVNGGVEEFKETSSKGRGGKRHLTPTTQGTNPIIHDDGGNKNESKCQTKHPPGGHSQGLW